MLTNNSLQHKNAAGANHSTETRNGNDFKIAPREFDQTPQSCDLASLSWNDIANYLEQNLLPANVQEVKITKNLRLLTKTYNLTELPSCLKASQFHGKVLGQANSRKFYELEVKNSPSAAAMGIHLVAIAKTIEPNQNDWESIKAEIEGFKLHQIQSKTTQFNFA